MTCNHAFTIAFSVGNSQHEDWAECVTIEKELVVAGLYARIAELELPSSEYPKAFDGFDTYEECPKSKCPLARQGGYEPSTRT